MNTLLAAVDFSDASQTVLGHAEHLASRMGARIVLIHVIEPVASYVPVGAAMDVIETAPPALYQENTDGLKGQLDRLAEPLTARGLSVETDVLIGLSAEEIVGKAAACEADYILLGSHGHGALYNLFAGSVVTGVLKHSGIPVVVVPIPKR